MIRDEWDPERIGERIVGDTLAPSIVLDAYQRRAWEAIRVEAARAHKLDGRHRYATADGTVHETADMLALARATLRERRLCGCRWPEDGAAKGN